jgi:hypothetical protein
MARQLAQIKVTIRAPKETWDTNQVNDACMAMEDMDIVDKVHKFVWDLLQKNEATEGARVEANW